LGVEGQAALNTNRRTTAIGLIVFGLVLVIFAIVYPFDELGSEEATTPTVPEQVAGIPLTAQVTGNTAVEEITQMHGKDFNLTDGSRGSYGPNHEIIIWVSGSASEADASQLVIDMRDKIAEGNSPFEIIGKELIDGRAVYLLEGLGQMHYYFQSGDQVIWLATNPDQAEDALAQVLEYYP
jgi:hypothetical protein